MRTQQKIGIDISLKSTELHLDLIIFVEKFIKTHLCFPSESINSRVLVLGTNGEVCARTPDPMAKAALPLGEK